MCGHPSLRSVCVESKTNATQSAYKERIRYAVVRSSIVWERLERSQKGRRLHLGCMNTRIHVCSYVYLFCFLWSVPFFISRNGGGPDRLLFIYSQCPTKRSRRSVIYWYFLRFFFWSNGNRPSAAVDAKKIKIYNRNQFNWYFHTRKRTSGEISIHSASRMLLRVLWTLGNVY